MTVMAMWTIYDRPSDFPDSFVARKWEITAKKSPYPTSDFITADTLEEIRNQLMALGMSAPLPRDSEDDDVIVETWV